MKLDDLNNKFIKINDVVTLEEMTLEQFLLTAVPRSKAHNIISETKLKAAYDMEESIPKYKDGEFKYYKQFATVQAVNINNLKKQFLEQYEKGKEQVIKLEKETFNTDLISGSKTIIKGKNLDKLIKKATEEIIENFGCPNCLVRLSKNKYMIGPSDVDAITLKLLSHSAGTIILYKPAQFQMIEVTNVK